MGLFNKKDAKKADEKAVVKETKNVKAVSAGKSAKVAAVSDAGSIIKNPRITEKAAYASDKNVYTFDISPRASKIDVAKAITAIYKVTPIKVNVVGVPTKRVYRKNSVGVKGGGKKAYVYLKKGDKIEFV